MPEEDFKAHIPAPVLPFLQTTALLGLESQDLPPTHLKCTIQWFLPYPHSSATISTVTTVDFIRFQPLKNHMPIKSCHRVVARTSLLPVAERYSRVWISAVWFIHSPGDDVWVVPPSYYGRRFSALLSACPGAELLGHVAALMWGPVRSCQPGLPSGCPIVLSHHSVRAPGSPQPARTWLVGSSHPSGCEGDVIVALMSISLICPPNIGRGAQGERES